METKESYEGWAVVELMGHRRLAGRVRQVTQYGAAMLRLDVPKGDTEDAGYTTQFYAGGAIYCVTPTTEEIARKIGSAAQPQPVHHFELTAKSTVDETDGDEEYESADDSGF